MSMVGKVIESRVGNAIYFTDGSSIIPDHLGRLRLLTAAETKKWFRYYHIEKPAPGTDKD